MEKERNSVSWEGVSQERRGGDIACACSCHMYVLMMLSKSGDGWKRDGRGAALRQSQLIGFWGSGH